MPWYSEIVLINDEFSSSIFCTRSGFTLGRGPAAPGTPPPGGPFMDIGGPPLPGGGGPPTPDIIGGPPPGAGPPGGPLLPKYKIGFHEIF